MIHHTPAVHHVEVKPPAPVVPVQPVQLSLDAAVVPDVVRALCQATGHMRFTLAPGVVSNEKKLTLSLDGSPDQVWADGLAGLRLAGVAERGLRSVAEFSDLVVASGVKVEPPQVVLTYDPVHRDVAFLSNALAGVFPNWHFAGAAAHGGGVQSGGGGSAVSAATGSSGGGGAQSGHATQTESVPVRLIGLGPVADRARLLMVLRQLDAPVQALVVHLAVYEVDTDVNTQSAIAFVGKLLGQTAQVGGSVATALSTSGLVGLTVNLGGFSAVAAALDSSNHAHLVTAPVLRTSSGVMASFAVGDSVPTLGSVSYTQGSSTPVQSVQYQQSGVVFSVVPELVGDTVDVALYQSISSFINTTVGVTSSPTLQNRVLSSDIVIRPGSVVVLGGLMQSSDTKTTGGWWLFPRLSRGDDVSRNELILVLSVDVAGP